MALSKLSSLISLRRQIPKWRCVITCHFSSSSASSAVIPFESSSKPSETSDTATATKVLPFNMFEGLSIDERYLSIISRIGMDGQIPEMKALCTSFFWKKIFKYPEDLIEFFVNNAKFSAAAAVLEVLHPLDIKMNYFYTSVVTVKKKTKTRPWRDFITYMCKNDQIDLALYQLRRMITQKSYCSPDKRTLEGLLPAVCEKKMIDECMMLVDQLFELKGPLPTNPDFYAPLIPFLCRANEPQRVVELFRMMKTARLTPLVMEKSDLFETSIADVYCDLVSGFCHLWRFDEAVEFLDEFYNPCSGPYNRLLEAYCNAGMIDEAYQFLQKTVEKDEHDVDSWCILVRSLIEDDQIDRALDTFKAMVDDWYKKKMLYNKNFPHIFSTSPSLLHTFLTTSFKTRRDFDPFLKLALHIMFIGGVWEEGLKYRVGEIEPSSGKQVLPLLME